MNFAYNFVAIWWHFKWLHKQSIAPLLLSRLLVCQHQNSALQVICEKKKISGTGIITLQMANNIDITCKLYSVIMCQTHECVRASGCLTRNIDDSVSITQLVQILFGKGIKRDKNIVIYIPIYIYNVGHLNIYIYIYIFKWPTVCHYMSSYLFTLHPRRSFDDITAGQRVWRTAVVRALTWRPQERQVKWSLVECL